MGGYLLIIAGLDFVQKKTGHTMGRDTNEKITDGARGLYEKATGYVDPPGATWVSWETAQ